MALCTRTARRRCRGGMLWPGQSWRRLCEWQSLCRQARRLSRRIGRRYRQRTLEEQSRRLQGWRRQPPTVVKNMVVIGYAGGEYATRGAITAYDQESGKEVWRTYT